MAEQAADELIALGVVTRAQGVRGQVRIKLHNPDSELLLKRKDAFLRRDGVVRNATFREPPRSHQGDVLIWLPDCDDRDQADALRGTEVCVPRSALPQLPPGEYYHRDLVGLEVRDVSGNGIGTVLRIETYPTIDVAVVKTPQGLLDVPILDPYWVDADVRGGCVTVDHLDDLRELTKSKD